MSTPQELARFHIETAIKLIGRDGVVALLTPDATTTAAPLAAAGRGRRPGAAPSEARCHWKLIDGSQCKNAHPTETNYCKMHSGKIDLIDL